MKLKKLKEKKFFMPMGLTYISITKRSDCHRNRLKNMNFFLNIRRSKV